MSSLAPLLQSFFTQRLLTQRNASPNTVAAYRDTFRLLLGFAHQHTGKAPSQLDIVDLDAALIGAFLDYLERERASSRRTRNARLTAIRSLFRYASFEHPEHSAVIARVLAIPPKRTDRPQVTFLTDAEVDALLASPNRSTRLGRRDHALLLLAVQTGLRVSELTALRRQDVHLGTGPRHGQSTTGFGVAVHDQVPKLMCDIEALAVVISLDGVQHHHRPEPTVERVGIHRSRRKRAEHDQQDRTG